MAVIRLWRPFEDTSAWRQLSVRLDGAVVARLRRGDVVDLDVECGPHVLQCRMDWCRSVPLTIDAEAKQPRVVQVAVPISVLVTMFWAPWRSLHIRELPVSAFEELECSSVGP